MQEIELARDRNKLEGRVKQGKFTAEQMKRWVLTPDIVSFFAVSAFGCNSY
jgi:hypothetical protein